MQDTFLARFTPSLMSHAALEAIFVQRETLAQSLIERIRDSVLTPAKHQMLLIGPRGMGKTHLVALVYHRIKAMADVQDGLCIAWLREEEWGITSFLDLLLRILRALHEEAGDAHLAEQTEALYGLSADEAERTAADLLVGYVGDRTLLIFAENLDAIFQGLGEQGQKQLRAFLQNHAFATILATAQSLFNGVSLRTSPFYGFFNIHHLPHLALNDATRLLTRVAEHEQDEDLVAFLGTPKGRARVRAVHHLAGGNPRVYLIFSQFLTRESLDALVEPFMQMLDDLTPYYQARMVWLSPLQRKITEFLIENRGAAPVKTIAERVFASPQTVSSQLKTLRDYGYVQAESAGRESFYELREPLMRLAIEVKKHRGKRIRLLLDFLRLWYTRPELEERLELLPPEAVLEREYLQFVLREVEEDGEAPRVAACWKDLVRYVKERDFEQVLQIAEELVEIRGEARDWDRLGSSFATLGRYEEGLACFERAVELRPDNVSAWVSRGAVLVELGRYKEALASIDRVLELNPEYDFMWSHRGWALGYLGRYEEVLVSFDRALELSPKKAVMWMGRGWALKLLGRYKEALTSYRKAIELGGDHFYPFFGCAVLLLALDRWSEGIEALDDALHRFTNAEVPEVENTGAILTGGMLKNLFGSRADGAVWQQRIGDLVAVYDKHTVLPVLAQGLVESITASTDQKNTQETLHHWLDAWQATVGDRDAFQLPLRLLDAAVRYREAEDPRVLLALPAEERRILEEVLGLEENAAG